MELKKQLEFFDPSNYEQEEIHVIGVGAIGSHLVEMLIRMGFTDIDVYDFDDVATHNLTNQMYYYTQLDEPKIAALNETCTNINPEIELRQHPEGWKPGTRLSGHVFLAVDDIDLRRAIVEENEKNSTIVSISDFRMGLIEAQHYFADKANADHMKRLKGSMAFTHEEAKDATPVSACGTSLNVIPTVRAITALGIANWMRYLREKQCKTFASVNVYTMDIMTF